MVLYFVVSFLASIVGAICGIGGGVVIKPTLDMLKLASVSTISFLSGCTVLSMSFYSVVKSAFSGERQVNMRTGTPTAIGAALGGIIGKELFSYVRGMFENQNAVGAVQALCLSIITSGTLIYTLKKAKIRTRNVEGSAACAGIGLALGIMSSFLGIGGGPINLVVLFYFFSMDTKTAAANSLYIIFFSQLTSVLSTVITGSVPEFEWVALVLMVAGGIGGGIVGRFFNRKMNERAVDKLFICLMFVIVFISVYNGWQYSSEVNL